MGVPPLLIAGMHRSGTSATARLLARAGVDFGSGLLPPTLDNPVGYFEDWDFFALNVALIAAGVGGDLRYQPDWAFPDRIASGQLAALRPRAAALLAKRGECRHAWGFKDPRTAVLLEFYDDVVPDAHYLFVYRAPWEVVDSLMRTALRPLAGRADLAVRAWTLYNERLLDFRARHPGRTALVHVDAVAHRPDAVVALAQAHLRALAPTTLDPRAARDAFVDELMHRAGAGAPIAELLAADHPEAIALYSRLEAAADLASDEPILNGNRITIEISPARGPVALNGVRVGTATDVACGAGLIACPRGGASPAEAADAGVGRIIGDVLAVVFEGTPRPDRLGSALAALAGDSGLGAVLLASGDDPPGAPREHDASASADGGAAVVLRRDAWLATRGFAAGRPPQGFEAYSFVVGCLQRGIRTARIDGALDAPLAAAGDAEGTRIAVLERHPRLAASRAFEAEAERDRIARQLRETEAERERITAQLEQLRATRSWRLVTRWWRLRERLRRSGRRRGRS